MHRHVSALLNPGLFDIQRHIAVVIEAMRAAWILREGKRGDHEAEGKRSDEHGKALLIYDIGLGFLVILCRRAGGLLLSGSHTFVAHVFRATEWDHFRNAPATHHIWWICKFSFFSLSALPITNLS